MGLRNHSGASSERNTAIPKEIGTAIKSAKQAEIKVPIIGTRAPYSSWTGSQLSFHKNWLPNFAMDSQLPTTKDINIASKTKNTPTAKNFVVFLNTVSAS